MGKHRSRHGRSIHPHVSTGSFVMSSGLIQQSGGQSCRIHRGHSVYVVLRGSRASLLAAGLMHSVFNRTNNENGIAAALLSGELYRLGILIAVVVLIAALALLAGRRRLSRAYRLELDANPAQQSGSVMTS